MPLMEMDDMTCAELVELVTEYLEDTLAPGEPERIRRHLLECDGCAAHVAQMRAVLRVAGTLAPEELSPAAGQQLTAVFRSWADERPAR
jgi:anti-sigma factor RsiW